MTVKVPPKGSRGVPFPRRLAALGNRFMVGRFRGRGVKTQGGVSTLLLETTGARTGKVRRAILGYLAEDAGTWLVIASLGGAARQPAWLHNLASQPRATIEFQDGERVPVTAATLDGTDLAEAWSRIERDAPEYANYRTKTDRTIPVLRLARR